MTIVLFQNKKMICLICPKVWEVCCSYYLFLMKKNTSDFCILPKALPTSFAGSEKWPLESNIRSGFVLAREFLKIEIRTLKKVNILCIYIYKYGTYMFICMCTYMYIYIPLHIYVYIIQLDSDVYIYIHIFICIHIYAPPQSWGFKYICC